MVITFHAFETSSDPQTTLVSLAEFVKSDSKKQELVPQTKNQTSTTFDYSIDTLKLNNNSSRLDKEIQIDLDFLEKRDIKPGTNDSTKASDKNLVPLKNEECGTKNPPISEELGLNIDFSTEKNSEYSSTNILPIDKKNTPYINDIKRPAKQLQLSKRPQLIIVKTNANNIALKDNPVQNFSKDRSLQTKSIVLRKNIENLNNFNEKNNTPIPTTTSDIKSPDLNPKFNSSIGFSSVPQDNKTTTDLTEKILSERTNNKVQKPSQRISFLNAFTSDRLDKMPRQTDDKLHLPFPVTLTVESNDQNNKMEKKSNITQSLLNLSIFKKLTKRTNFTETKNSKTSTFSNNKEENSETRKNTKLTDKPSPVKTNSSSIPSKVPSSQNKYINSERLRSKSVSRKKKDWFGSAEEYIDDNESLLLSYGMSTKSFDAFSIVNRKPHKVTQSEKINVVLSNRRSMNPRVCLLPELGQSNEQKTKSLVQINKGNVSSNPHSFGRSGKRNSDSCEKDNFYKNESESDRSSITLTDLGAKLSGEADSQLIAEDNNWCRLNEEQLRNIYLNSVNKLYGSVGSTQILYSSVQNDETGNGNIVDIHRDIIEQEQTELLAKRKKNILNSRKIKRTLIQRVLISKTLSKAQKQYSLIKNFNSFSPEISSFVCNQNCFPVPRNKDNINYCSNQQGLLSYFDYNYINTQVQTPMPEELENDSCIQSARSSGDVYQNIYCTNEVNNNSIGFLDFGGKKENEEYNSESEEDKKIIEEQEQDIDTVLAEKSCKSESMLEQNMEEYRYKKPIRNFGGYEVEGIVNCYSKSLCESDMIRMEESTIT
ncbi:hypothetical protein BB559_005913 [Furculomyces boomerangus]|uniref:Uncharacterized protein n=1 Tax=Furculomyces boomerangus TaxID=61424 RepID=A0A2T9Y5Y3_9FUNG|nr:hypothetical protein BB559_005913 [Furculomyces boomerangus]